MENDDAPLYKEWPFAGKDTKFIFMTHSDDTRRAMRALLQSLIKCKFKASVLAVSEKSELFQEINDFR